MCPFDPLFLHSTQLEEIIKRVRTTELGNIHLVRFDGANHFFGALHLCFVAVRRKERSSSCCSCGWHPQERTFSFEMNELFLSIKRKTQTKVIGCRWNKRWARAHTSSYVVDVVVVVVVATSAVKKAIYKSNALVISAPYIIPTGGGGSYYV